MYTQQPSPVDDELPGIPPAEQPTRPPPAPGPGPAPVPEKLPGDAPEPNRSPTETPPPMHVQAAPRVSRTDDEEGSPPVTEAQPVERRLIGSSQAMDAVRRMIVRVAPTDSAVLICGESGCGKELVAESLHAGSPRAEARSSRSTAAPSRRR
jgi:hypothetical protein